MLYLDMPTKGLLCLFLDKPFILVSIVSCNLGFAFKNKSYYNKLPTHYRFFLVTESNKKKIDLTK